MSELSEHRTASRGHRGAPAVRRRIVPALIMGLMAALSLQGQAQQLPAAAPANKLGQDPDKEAMFVKLRTEQATEEMEEMIEDLKGDYSLNKDKVRRLETAGAKAVASSLDAWAEEFGKFLSFRKRHVASRASAIRSSMMFNFQFGTLIRQPAASTEAAFVSDFRSPQRGRPQSQPEWTKTMERVLTKSQLAEWKKKTAEEIAGETKRIEDFLNATEKSIAEKQREKMSALLMSIQETIKPDAEQIKQLEELASDTRAAALKQWRANSRFILERSSQKAWQGYSRMAIPDDPGRSPQWQKSLAALLKPEQKELMKARAASDKEVESYQLIALVEANVPSVLPAMQQRIRTQLDRLVTAIEADEPTREKLSEAAEAAVDQSMVLWRAAGLKGLREMDAKARANVLRSRRYRFGASGDGLAPEKQKAWTSAVEELLTAGQKAAWQADDAVREEEETTRFVEVMDTMAQGYQSQFEASLTPQIQDLVSTLDLSEERADVLRGTARKAAVESTEAWRGKARGWLAALEPNQRGRFLQQGRLPVSTNDARTAATQPAWLATLRGVLTPEESARWEQTLRDRETKRQSAVGAVMLASVEEWVGIREDQWAPLAELCRKQAKQLSSQIRTPRFNMNQNQIGRALKLIPEQRVRDTLDDAQWERWRAGIAIVERQGNFLPMQIRKARGDALPNEDTNLIAKAITKVIHERNRQQKQRALLLLTAETDIGTRAAELSPEARKRLKTAAKGAAEEVVNQWDATFSSFLLKRIKGATPKTIFQQLAAASNQGGRLDSPLNSPVWKETLRVSLDDAQLKAWEEAALARENRQRDAVADLVTVFIEGHVGLEPDQTEIFREKVITSINTYGPDLERFFSSRNSKWYLQYFGMGIAVMGIPENELRSMLSEDQIDIWEFKLRNVAANNWPRVLQYHRQRMEKEQQEKDKPGS